MATNQMSRHSKRPKPTKKPKGQKKKNMHEKAAILPRLLPTRGRGSLRQAFRVLMSQDSLCQARRISE